MNPDAIPASWLLLGFGGQAFFSARFLLQWLISERRKTSVVPTLFWWLSLGGGVCLLVYAVLRRDVVIIVGQAAGLAVYGRNLFLLRRAVEQGAVEAGTPLRCPDPPR